MKLTTSFGQYLREHGGLSTAALDEAARSLVLLGGRLGTNLVRSGALDLDELEELLSDFIGSPRAPAEWLAAPSKEAIGCLPEKFLWLHGVLPLRINGDGLHVAMRDPDQQVRIDTLAKAGGRPVVPYSISEVRLAFLHEKVLGLAPAAHLEALRQHLDGKKRGKTIDPESSASHQERVIIRAELGLRPLEEGAELTDPESFESAMGAPTRDLGGASPKRKAPKAKEPEAVILGEREGIGSPGALAAAERDLTIAPNRNGVTRAALAIAGAFAESAAFFAVHDGQILGTMAIREDRLTDIGGIALPTTTGSCLAEVARTGRVRLGPPNEDVIDDRLFDALGYSTRSEMLAQPVHIGDRIVGILVAESGNVEPGPVAIAALAELAEAMTRAFERLILERRSRYRGGQTA